MSTSVTASTSLPDCPRPSRLRRFSLRTYTHNLTSSPSGQRSARHSLSSRIPWRFSNSDSISPTNSTTASPCPESDHPTLSRYISAPAPSYGFATDLNSQLSSTESAISSTPSNDHTQPTPMARLMSVSAVPRPPPRTLETSTNNSQEPTPQESNPPPEPIEPAEPAVAQSDAIDPTSAPAEEQVIPSKMETKAIIRFFPYQDSVQSSRPSLPFAPISRTLPSESCVIRVGRYSERDGVPSSNPTEPSDAPVGFKSKVVSRKHCEFLYVNGQWHIKDVGSSSGTFLNHMRLSQPNMVSRLYSIKDGDIVQLGIDFRGGEEMIFRCVRIRIECNRSWQQQPNEFKCDFTYCPECRVTLTKIPAKTQKALSKTWARARLLIIRVVVNARFALALSWFVSSFCPAYPASTNYNEAALSMSVHGSLRARLALQMYQSSASLPRLPNVPMPQLPCIHRSQRRSR